MCTQNTLQQHILQITNDGKTVADFLHDTMQGKTHNAKIHHQIDAAKQLAKIALNTDNIADTTIRHSCALTRHSCESRNPEGRAEALVSSPTAHPELVEGHEDEQTQNPTHPVHPVTDLDIINHEIATLIRDETNDGFFIAQFLARVMQGIDSQGRIISPSIRMIASKELLNRGFGRFGDSRTCRFSNAQDEDELINSGLARYIRESTNHGKYAAYFLLDVASGQDTDFSTYQRVVAARELIRRGWDTNYKAVTPAAVAAYRERQEALRPTEYDIRAQEWQESEQETERKAEQEAERAAQDEQPEEEPQLEDGFLAHLTFAEVDRYEAMTPQQQADFIQQQRNRANIRSP